MDLPAAEPIKPACTVSSEALRTLGLALDAVFPAKRHLLDYLSLQLRASPELLYGLDRAAGRHAVVLELVARIAEEGHLVVNVA